MKQIIILLTYRLLHPTADIYVKHPKKLSNFYHITDVSYSQEANTIYITIAK